MKSNRTNTLITAIACLIAVSTTNAFGAETSAPNYAKAVNSYLQLIVNPADTGNCIGTTAIIKVAYANNGQLDQAAISSAGDVSLARMLHRSVNWKSFPANGTAETTIIVAVNTAGTLDVAVK
jgi:hypothetical protein